MGANTVKNNLPEVLLRNTGKRSAGMTDIGEHIGLLDGPEFNFYGGLRFFIRAEIIGI